MYIHTAEHRPCLPRLCKGKKIKIHHDTSLDTIEFDTNAVDVLLLQKNLTGVKNVLYY